MFGVMMFCHIYSSIVCKLNKVSSGPKLLLTLAVKAEDLWMCLGWKLDARTDKQIGCHMFSQINLFDKKNTCWSCNVCSHEIRNFISLSIKPLNFWLSFNYFNKTFLVKIWISEWFITKQNVTKFIQHLGRSGKSNSLNILERNKRKVFSLKEIPPTV